MQQFAVHMEFVLLWTNVIVFRFTMGMSANILIVMVWIQHIHSYVEIEEHVLLIINVNVISTGSETNVITKDVMVTTRTPRWFVPVMVIAPTSTFVNANIHTLEQNVNCYGHALEYLAMTLRYAAEMESV